MPEPIRRFARRNALRGHTLSFREERVWRKTRQRTHGSLETPSSKTGSPPKPSVSGFGGERRSSGVSELFALGRKREIRSLRRRSANAFALTNRCQSYSHWCLARILISGGVPELRPICSTEGKYRSTPLKLRCVKSFSSTGSPPLRAYCAPEVVRSNAVGSPLGGRVRGKIAGAVGNPSGDGEPLRQNRGFCHLPLQGRLCAPHLYAPFCLP